MKTCQVDFRRIMAALDLSSFSRISFIHTVAIAHKLCAGLAIRNVINSREIERMS